MAVNCCVVPNGAAGFSGVTVIVVSVAGVTVTVVESLMEPEVAVTVAEATAAPVTSPPPVIAAVLVLEELQATKLVRLFVLPSVNVPVAVNCCVVPKAIDGLAGVMAIEISAGGFTVSVVDPMMLPKVAVMVVSPVATVFASPAAETVATPGAEDDQVTEFVMLEDVPLL